MALTIAEYRTALRAYIKDHDYLNRLLTFKEENINDELDLYLNMSMSFLNSIPPPIKYFGWSTFPIPSLLIHQASIEALISNGIIASRNEIDYNNGGITTKVYNGDRYLRQLQLLYRQVDAAIHNFKQMKISININGGYGGISSPYALLHGSDGTLQPNSILSG